MTDALLLDEVVSVRDWDCVRRAMLDALIHRLIAHPELWRSLDTASVKALMRPSLEAMPNRPLFLAVLWQHLVRQGAPIDVAAEAVAAIGDDARRLGVPVMMPGLPAPCATLA